MCKDCGLTRYQRVTGHERMVTKIHILAAGRAGTFLDVSTDMHALFRLGILAATTMALACSDMKSNVRQATYPKSFAYIEAKDIRNEMWALARDVHAIDGLLREAPADQEQVVAVLYRMEETVTALDKGAVNTNHPRLDENLQRFRKDIEGARQAVQREPANYFLAGSIAGSCMYCHR